MATRKRTGRVYRPFKMEKLELRNVVGKVLQYKGRRALRLVESVVQDDGHALALVTGSEFQDGVIETWVAGLPTVAAAEGARGFVGIAFRASAQGEQFECFYLRPTNGRANNQLRRNHATQYISHPDYPWYKLREENPGVYESYTDLVTGAWTKLKIVVAGVRAQLYVNDAPQPCLIVNDLKLGETGGQIGFWIGAGTEAYFSQVTVK